jgi:hypothetical protein
MTTDAIHIVDDFTFDLTPTSSSSNEFIVNTHVTMGVVVDVRNDDTTTTTTKTKTPLSKAKSLYEKFGKLQGRHVPISVKGLYWSETNAALAVDVGARTATDADVSDENAAAATVDVPPCENAFHHITIWCKTGSRSVQSNQLPLLHREGKAQYVDFTKLDRDDDDDDDGDASSLTTPTTLQLIGTVSFWNHNNQVI